MKSEHHNSLTTAGNSAALIKNSSVARARSLSDANPEDFHLHDLQSRVGRTVQAADRPESGGSGIG